MPHMLSVLTRNVSYIFSASMQTAKKQKTKALFLDKIFGQNA